jgi:spore germination cell wall hydrolase CwlJ-like protein
MIAAAMRNSATRLMEGGLRLPSSRMPAVSLRHGAASAMLVLSLLLYLIAGLSLSGIGMPDGRASARQTLGSVANGLAEAPPAPEPLAFRDIAPQDAVAINASVPLSTAPNPPARPFLLNARTEADRIRALECLTAAVYYEAAIEPLDGQRAVAQVVLNRVRHPAYPNTVCGVVFQGAERSTGCQFTFTCDGSLARTPNAGLWRQARQVAEAALAGKVFKPVGWATHYHTNWVVPYWSSSLVKAALVGTHIFYRWEGGWGRGPAFRFAHPGTEPGIAKMVHLSSVPIELAEGEIPPELDAAGQAREGVTVIAADFDLSKRAVVRHYEPTQGQAVAAILTSQAKAGDAPSTHLWSLTGGGSGPKQVPFGRNPEGAGKPAPPAELAGVRKVGEAPAKGD